MENSTGVIFRRDKPVWRNAIALASLVRSGWVRRVMAAFALILLQLAVAIAAVRALPYAVPLCYPAYFQPTTATYTTANGTIATSMSEFGERDTADAFCRWRIAPPGATRVVVAFENEPNGPHNAFSVIQLKGDGKTAVVVSPEIASGVYAFDSAAVVVSWHVSSRMPFGGWQLAYSSDAPQLCSGSQASSTYTGAMVLHAHTPTGRAELCDFYIRPIVAVGNLFPPPSTRVFYGRYSGSFRAVSLAGGVELSVLDAGAAPPRLLRAYSSDQPPPDMEVYATGDLLIRLDVPAASTPRIALFYEGVQPPIAEPMDRSLFFLGLWACFVITLFGARVVVSVMAA